MRAFGLSVVAVWTNEGVIGTHPQSTFLSHCGRKAKLREFGRYPFGGRFVFEFPDLKIHGGCSSGSFFFGELGIDTRRADRGKRWRWAEFARYQVGVRCNDDA